MGENMINERAAKRRKELKMTQREVATLLNVTSDTISRIERGVHVPHLEQIVGLARALRVSTDWLLGLVDDPKDLFQSSDLSPKEIVLLKRLRSDPRLEELLDVAERIQSHRDGIDSG